jgi:putative FmdB family regulatory protein
LTRSLKNHYSQRAVPIYEYICQSCGEEIEVIQKVSDHPLRKHQGCGGKLEKKLSLSAFHLKGSGWYTDGYSKGDKQTEAKMEAENGTHSKEISKPEQDTKKADKNTKQTDIPAQKIPQKPKQESKTSSEK